MLENIERDSEFHRVRFKRQQDCEQLLMIFGTISRRYLYQQRGRRAEHLSSGSVIYLGKFFDVSLMLNLFDPYLSAQREFFNVVHAQLNIFFVFM